MTLTMRRRRAGILKRTDLMTRLTCKDASSLVFYIVQFDYHGPSVHRFCDLVFDPADLVAQRPNVNTLNKVLILTID